MGALHGAHRLGPPPGEEAPRGSSPYRDAGASAGGCVGCHSCAQTFAVPSDIASTGISDTLGQVGAYRHLQAHNHLLWSDSNLPMTSLKHVRLQNGAFFSGPVLPMGKQ